LQLLRQPNYPQKNAPRRNNLDHYALIKFPLTTKLSMKKIEDNNTLVFFVDVKATKHRIKQAVKKLYASQAWWRTPLIPALGRQRQADF
jgi:large subunit ribosomal protein L23Ae